MYVDLRGFEPLTFCMPYRHASQLRHRPVEELDYNMLISALPALEDTPATPFTVNFYFFNGGR